MNLIKFQQTRQRTCVQTQECQGALARTIGGQTLEVVQMATAAIQTIIKVVHGALCSQVAWLGVGMYVLPVQLQMAANAGRTGKPVQENAAGIAATWTLILVVSGA